MKEMESNKRITFKEFLIIVVMMMGIVLVALPALVNVKKASRKFAITRNLETIATVGKHYYLETGSTEPIKVKDLKNEYCMNIYPVAKESYDELYMSPERGVLVVKARDVVVDYSYDFKDEQSEAF